MDIILFLIVAILTLLLLGALIAAPFVLVKLTRDVKRRKAEQHNS